MTTVRNDPCAAERQAVNDAKQALAENKESQNHNLKTALEKANKIYKLTKNKLDDPDYKEIHDAARNLYNAAKTQKTLNEVAKGQLDFKASVINDAEIAGAASSLSSLVFQYVEAVNEQRQLEQTLKDAEKALKKCETTSGTTGATSGTVGGLCFAPRTGHGHVDEPCHVRLGKDGICQHHGPRDQVMVA